jgi:acyl-CoA thioesterase I
MIAMPEPKTYLAEFRLQAQKKWPENRTLNIVFHGHSVPSGYFTGGEVRTHDAYPHLLHLNLKERYPRAVINVIVTAIGGENARRGAERFDADVLCHKPDVLLIDYSLNDRAIGLEPARVAWQQMIDVAKSRGIPVILLTPTPDLKSEFRDPADPLAQHAEQVRNLARSNGVGLVDSLKAFSDAISAGTDPKTLMSQNNHPNRQGHEIVARELIKWFD